MEIVEYCVYGDPVYGRDGFGPANKCPSNLERESVTYVLKSQFDRILAERDALQQRLNAVEEENDRLRSLAKEARNEFLTIKAAIGFRAETLRVIGALDIELEKRP